MSGKVFFVLFPFLLILSFTPPTPGTTPMKVIQREYNRADAIFNSPNTTPAKDSLCMVSFRNVIALLKPLSGSRLADSLLFQSNYKLGVLYEMYTDYEMATACYIQSMRFSTSMGERFRMNELIGAGYYNQNNFDSATYFLLKAEEMSVNAEFPEERVRLYNSLGVLYYDNGNYLQSKNYFGQALHQIRSFIPKYIKDGSRIQLNIAACFYKLGQFEQALSIYREIIKTEMLPDLVYINMGKAYAGLNRYEEALASFRKVNSKVVPGVLNEMARVALESGRADSSSIWLSDYQTERKSVHANALDDGVNELYSADLDLFYLNPELAIRHLQKALIIFSGNFHEMDYRKNPETFTGSFAYYRLFEVLVKKAQALEMLYRKTLKPEDLKSSYDTYQSTIALLSYIEKSYEMDDAKILLKKRSAEVYTNALNVSLALNKLFPYGQYIESAFLISEKNKASVMSAQIRERHFLKNDEGDDELASQERNIKYNIARLNSREDERIDAKKLQEINDEKSEYETQLVGLRRKMEGNKKFYQSKYSDDFPSVKQLQEKMTDDQALISFYNEFDKIHVFVLTRSSLDHIQLDSGELIKNNIQAWIQTLQVFETGHRSVSDSLKRKLYNSFIKPIVDFAGNKEQWIVIPDGIFFLLPLESLPSNAKGRLVLEDHDVGYQFSSRFIMENNVSDLAGKKSVLSFAPFTRSGADLGKLSAGWLEKLPYSKQEIEGLTGARFEDVQATKDKFLKNLNQYPIVHLATHAITDLQTASASYIAFYPVSAARSEDLLFLDEIYSLRMDSCKLMVISACETGRGELVRSEGVISFARAFLYAGCPSTINTLWKADDRTTAQILKSFYKFLEQGYTKSKALQLAKLEFIREHPIQRNPAYWSHIILTGDPSPLYNKKQPWLWVVLIAASSILLFFLFQKFLAKKSGVLPTL